MFRRTLWSLVLVGGLIGMAGCVVAAIGGWVVATRVNHALGGVMSRVDDTLSLLGERNTETEQRIDSLKITTAGLVESLESQVEGELQERPVSKLDLERRVDQLMSGMEQVEQWVEVSQSSAEVIDELMRVVESAGVHVDSTTITMLKGEIESVRDAWNKVRELVQQTDALVERIQAGDDSAKGLLSEVLVKLAATVVPIEEQVQRLSQRLDEARTAVADTQVGLQWRVRWITILGSCILVWLAVGQVALSYFAWGCARR